MGCVLLQSSGRAVTAVRHRGSVRPNASLASSTRQVVRSVGSAFTRVSATPLTAHAPCSTGLIRRLSSPRTTGIHWLCAECCDTLLEETDWVCPLCGTDVTTAVSLVTVGLAATTQPTLGTRPRTPPPTSGDEETHSPSLRNEADETQETEMAWSEHGSPERGSPGAPRI